MGSNVFYKCDYCQETISEIVPELIISVSHTGTSSATMNGYGSYSQSFQATANGGYGEYQYKFEVFSNSSLSYRYDHLTAELSASNIYSVGYKGYSSALNGRVLKVTVQDEAGNTASVTYTFYF